jgi:hypothetical protein
MGRIINRNFKTTIRKTSFVFAVLFLTFNSDYCLGKEENSNVQTPAVATDRHPRFRPTVHQDLMEEYKRIKIKKPETKYSKDCLFVRFKPNTEIKKIGQDLSPIGKHRICGPLGVKKTNLYSLKITNGMSLQKAVKQLTANPSVLSVSKMPLLSVNK